MLLGCAGRMGWGEAQVKRLAAELVEGLASMGALAGAATVAVQYLQDLDNGVSLLTQAREWREALRVAYKSAPLPLSTSLRLCPHTRPLVAWPM